MVLVAVIQAFISRQSEKKSNRLREGAKLVWLCLDGSVWEVNVTSTGEIGTPTQLSPSNYIFLPSNAMHTSAGETQSQSSEPEIDFIWEFLLTASSESELEQSLCLVEEFLSKHPNHEKGLFLRGQVIKALKIELSRKARILRYWRLSLFIFVLIRICLSQPNEISKLVAILRVIGNSRGLSYAQNRDLRPLGAF